MRLFSRDIRDYQFINNARNHPRSNPELPTRWSHARYVYRLLAFGTLGDFEFDFITFLQRTKTFAENTAEVDEHILLTITGDEAKTLLIIKPLNFPSGHTKTHPFFRQINLGIDSGKPLRHFDDARSYVFRTSNPQATNHFIYIILL
jgi:hypothetical protein